MVIAWQAGPLLYPDAAAVACHAEAQRRGTADFAARARRAKPPWPTSCARRGGPHSGRPRRTGAGRRRRDADSCCTGVPRGHVRQPPQWMMIESVVHRRFDWSME